MIQACICQKAHHAPGSTLEILVFPRLFELRFEMGRRRILSAKLTPLILGIEQLRIDFRWVGVVERNRSVDLLQR
jgi:hypothetical protein